MVGCDRENGKQQPRTKEAEPFAQIQSRMTNSFAQIGRFQIVSGIIARGDEKQNVMMKIDTATGESWRYEVWIFPGHVAGEGWRENKSFDEEIEVARALSEKLKAEKDGKVAP